MFKIIVRGMQTGELWYISHGEPVSAVFLQGTFLIFYYNISKYLFALRLKENTSLDYIADIVFFFLTCHILFWTLEVFWYTYVPSVWRHTVWYVFQTGEAFSEVDSWLLKENSKDDCEKCSQARNCYSFPRWTVINRF